MLEEERGYRLFKVPGGEKKKDKEKEISSCLFSLEISHQQCGGKKRKKEDQKLTQTVAMTHLLFCSRNRNLHTLVV